MTTPPPHGKLVKIEIPQTPTPLRTESELPAALSDYKVKTTEAQQFVRANSVSGAKSKMKIEERRPKIQVCSKSLYIKMGVQMFVCLSVGMWRSNGNPNPCTNLDEFCTHIPTCPRKVLVQV